ncbi:phospho-sugar mutase [Brevibacillus sp. SYSU BS000544]|uniref:phospho-sugar mutase n=1 Tax=Brevibacillus sp. SYSU BS000544 TaxID=3416443 RepID=UPI003CE4F79F
MSDYTVPYERWKNHRGLPSYLANDLSSISSEKEIEDRFYRYLQFGTAGLRGIIGAGTNRINTYIIRRATHGFAQFLLRQGDSSAQKSVVIAYDSRHFSEDFAREAAGSLAYHGIMVYLFEELRPTPMLSFAVRHLGASGGIVITASHNPPEYNGYKVYNPQGGQISTKIAQEISQYINSLEDELTLPAITAEEAIQKGFLEMIGTDIDEAYQAKLRTLLSTNASVLHAAKDINITFTPLHGTGNRPLMNALQNAGFVQAQLVAAQASPDPNFSTVSSPNPEEPIAFQLAIHHAKDNASELILATDPDADRLGLAVRTINGEYGIISGNQIGALLLHYVLDQKKATGSLPGNAVVVKTIVTSELGRAIADSFGVTMQETLTGFKYIAEKIEDFQQTGSHTFLFGYEESNGYLIGDFVRDKDAIQAGLLLSEMAAFYKEKEKSLLDVLNDLYKEHGYFTDDLLSFTLKGREGAEKISKMMNAVRTTTPSQIAGIAVIESKDYLPGIEGLPSSDVVKLLLEDGSWLAFRPSGTEPKMKVYFGVVDTSREASVQKVSKLKEAVLELLGN